MAKSRTIRRTQASTTESSQTDSLQRKPSDVTPTREQLGQSALKYVAGILEACVETWDKLQHPPGRTILAPNIEIDPLSKQAAYWMTGQGLIEAWESRSEVDELPQWYFNERSSSEWMSALIKADGIRLMDGVALRDFWEKFSQRVETRIDWLKGVDDYLASSFYGRELDEPTMTLKLNDFIAHRRWFQRRKMSEEDEPPFGSFDYPDDLPRLAKLRAGDDSPANSLWAIDTLCEEKRAASSSLKNPERLAVQAFKKDGGMQSVSIGVDGEWTKANRDFIEWRNEVLSGMRIVRLRALVIGSICTHWELKHFQGSPGAPMEAESARIPTSTTRLKKRKLTPARARKAALQAGGNKAAAARALGYTREHLTRVHNDRSKKPKPSR